MAMALDSREDARARQGEGARAGGPGSRRARGNLVSGNDVSGNLIDGAYVEDSSQNTFLRNRAVGNGSYGFEFFGTSNRNTLKRNTATGNGSDGVVLDGNSSNNLVKGNTASANDNVGIEVFGGSGNLLVGNDAHENGEHGIRSETSALTLLKNEADRNGFLSGGPGDDAGLGLLVRRVRSARATGPRATTTRTSARPPTSTATCPSPACPSPHFAPGRAGARPLELRHVQRRARAHAPLARSEDVQGAARARLVVPRDVPGDPRRRRGRCGPVLRGVRSARPSRGHGWMGAAAAPSLEVSETALFEASMQAQPGAPFSSPGRLRLPSPLRSP